MSQIRASFDELATKIATGSYVNDAVNVKVNALKQSIDGVRDTANDLLTGQHLTGIKNSLKVIDEAVEKLQTGQHLTDVLDNLTGLQESVKELNETVGRANQHPPASIQNRLTELDKRLVGLEATRKAHTWVLGLITSGVVAVLARVFGVV